MFVLVFFIIFFNSIKFKVIYNNPGLKIFENDMSHGAIRQQGWIKRSGLSGVEEGGGLKGINYLLGFSVCNAPSTGYHFVYPKKILQDAQECWYFLGCSGERWCESQGNRLEGYIMYSSRLNLNDYLDDYETDA